MEAAGWTKTSRTFENGTEDEGYWKREAQSSIIAERKRWEINPGDGQRRCSPGAASDKAKEANGGRRRQAARITWCWSRVWSRLARSC